jgi:hypothetical protein
MMDADFLYRASKSVEVSPNLPPATLSKKYRPFILNGSMREKKKNGQLYKCCGKNADSTGRIVPTLIREL